MINMFSRLATDLGSLDKIAQWVKLTGFVASTPEFTAQPTVMNAASDLVVEVFGDLGRHTRSAVGVSSLPLGTPVEIEAILRLKA
jgi:enamine deaminase RidA (YjgF/YER057c/UK114 family)